MSRPKSAQETEKIMNTPSTLHLQRHFQTQTYLCLGPLPQFRLVLHKTGKPMPLDTINKQTNQKISLLPVLPTKSLYSLSWSGENVFLLSVVAFHKLLPVRVSMQLNMKFRETGMINQCVWG